MDTYGGGWTVLQRRGDFGHPKDYFLKNWEEYKFGFGEPNEVSMSKLTWEGLTHMLNPI